MQESGQRIMHLLSTRLKKNAFRVSIKMYSKPPDTPKTRKRMCSPKGGQKVIGRGFMTAAPLPPTEMFVSNRAQPALLIEKRTLGFLSPL